MADISSLLKGAGAQAVNVTAGASGAEVENFSREQLAKLPGIGGDFKTSATSARPTHSSIWDATSYAAALAGKTELRPKLKFLFKVQFFFSPEILNKFEGAGSQFQPMLKQLQENKFTFMVKQVDRPKVDFDYEEDINQYNFRTKALKRITHRELTITFMDDVGNNVIDFFRAMLMIYQPVTRGSILRDNRPNERARGDELMGSGMDFKTTGVANFASHRDVLDTVAGQAISVIRLQQIFLNPSDSAKPIKAIFYDHINPRLKSFDLDDLTHESSDPNLLTMQFDYDWLEVTKHDNVLTNGLGSSAVNTIVPSAYVQAKDEKFGNVQGATFTGAGISGDMLSGLAKDTKPDTVSNAKGSGPNAFASILNNLSGNVSKSLTANVLNKAVKTVAGNGAFANSMIGRAVTGSLNNVASNISGSIGNAVSGFTKANNPLNGMSFSSLFSSKLPQSVPPMVPTNLAANDTTTAGPDAVTVATSTNPGGTG